MWSGGIPLTSTILEQITYLMFIRSLDEKELEREALANSAGVEAEHIFPQSEAGQSMRWSRFKNKDPREIYEIMSNRVFPAIRRMKDGRLPDYKESGELIEVSDGGSGQSAFERFIGNADFKLRDPQLLQKVITGLDELYEEDLSGQDMLGDLYEYMLSKMAAAGQNGQFRTPKHIREMMVELVKPTPDDLICDPACGTAGFLVSAAEYIRRNYEDTMTAGQWDRFASETFTGYDIDQTMLRFSAMNLMLHSITDPDIDYKDSLSKQNNVSGKYTVCLANPPFTGSIDTESIHDNLKAVTNTKSTELLFLALFLRLLRKGGRCACVVPAGVLFDSTKAHLSIRRELVENHQLKAVISMPSGVFRPYTGVTTAVLVFVKTDAGGTENVWFYDMRADGFSLDEKRVEIAENDIPDIIARFGDPYGEKNRQRTEQSFFVPKSEIVKSNYNLSINSYKEAEYKPAEYPPSGGLMAELDGLYKELGGALAELGGLLDE